MTMHNNHLIIRKSELATSLWSGGNTTQLAIYPRDALYAERNFLWRVSTASVELEESDFTPLIGVYRHIMVLTGELYLTHEGCYGKLLKPFEQDSFWGDWKTRGVGRVTDFNLMLKDGCVGCIDVITVAPQQARAVLSARLAVELRQAERSEVLYFTSSAQVKVGHGKAETLQAGDVLILHSANNSEYCLTIQNTQNSSLRVARASVAYQPTFAS